MLSKTLEKHFSSCVIILTVLFITLCLYDLFAPPISKTIWRQTQTAMLTENFLKEDFSLNGLYLNITGTEKPLMVYEFPIYNLVVGSFFAVVGNSPFWGKFVSLLASIICLILIVQNIRWRYGKRLGLLTGLFFAFSPVGLMMYTSFQPDSFGLMFMMMALWLLSEWTESRSIIVFVLFSLSLLIAGLAKYPLLVPYIPLVVLALLPKNLRIAFQDIKFMAIFIVIFLIPFLGWYLYSRMFLTDFSRTSQLIDNMFFIGDLTRFISVSYYTKIGFTIPFLTLSGFGTFFFIMGLRKLDSIQAALLFGIPLYFIVIPTARDQWYYLHASVPIFSFFMAKGFVSLIEWSVNYRRKIMLTAATLIFLVGFMVCSSFTLSRDKVSLQAASTLNKVTNLNDLVFFVNIHDRATGIGGNNPTLSYLSKRTGWNIQLQGFDLHDIVMQIQKSKENGARWVLITYYTSDLEPIISGILPSRFHRNPTFSYPGLDGLNLINLLMEQEKMAIETQGPNFVILRMDQ